MRNFPQKFGALVLALLLSVVAIAPNALADVPGVTDTEIKLGVALSLSGGLAHLGATLDGLRTWVEEINEAGGIHGRKITLIAYDDQSSVQVAQSSTRRLLHQDQVFALVCGGGGSQTLAVADLVRMEKVPFVNCITANSQLIGDDERYIFRIYANDVAQSQAVIKYVVETLGAKRPAIIYNSADIGITGHEIMRGMLRNEYGLDFVAAERYNVDEQAFRPLLLRIAQQRPDVLIVNGFPYDSGLVVRQARELGLSIPLVGGGATPTPLLPEAAGRAAVGFHAVWVFPVLPEDVTGPVGALRELQQKYVLKDGYPVGRPTLYDLTGYMAGKVVEEGLRRAGRDLTRESFVDALRTIENFDPAGLGFPVTFTDDNEGTYETSIVRVNEDLQWEIIDR